MTQEEFLNREIYIWSEDYIFDLLDRGYEVKLTTAGWRWIAPVTVTNTNTNSCAVTN